MTELWDAVRPWLPWMVPAIIGALVLLFACSMVWPDRTARALGIFAIAWDSFAKRFRRSRGAPEPTPPRRSGDPGAAPPPTITGFAVPPVERKDDERKDDA